MSRAHQRRIHSCVLRAGVHMSVFVGHRVAAAHMMLSSVHPPRPRPLCVATANTRLGRWAQAENRFTITYCPPTDGPISQADIESTNLQCELPTPAPL